jgi:PAS domain S-box-containing protein
MPGKPWGIKSFRDIPVSQKLYFTVGIMATLIVIELGTLFFAINTLSSLRAYVGGEGLWSKGQKDALFHLQKFGHTHNEQDYRDFLTFMKVPMGDHKARVELLKPEPDMAVARQGFIEGRNHPDDVDGMIKLFRRFHRVYYIDKAIRIWGAADPLIMQLGPLGEQLHDEIASAHPSQAHVDQLMKMIESTNDQLTILEDNFSFTLGEGSRWLEHLILRLLFGVAITVEISGLVLAISVSRSIQQGLTEIIRACRAIATGDFNARAQVFSGDEIGVLAASVNTMADDLSKADNRFKRLIESAPDAKVVVNSNGIIRLVNAQTEKMFQYQREELIGRPVEMLIPEALAAGHPEHRAHYYADPQVRMMGTSLELYGKRKSGEKFPVEISLSPLETDEGIWVTSSIRDVTDKKHDHEALTSYARKLEVSNNNLEQFAYVASHDLQEPLRTITNFVSLLDRKLQHKADGEVVQYMSFITSASERMKTLIKELLMYSRLGKNRMIEEIDCGKVVQDVVKDMEALVSENNATISYGQLPVLDGSATELQQLFQNLLANAIKYRKPDVAPEIQIDSADIGPDWLFSVMDNGIGIDEEYNERIFVIFQRLHNQDEYSGTGIGLATCRKIVELNGGTIWVKSKPGRGSVFYFTFPKEIKEHV